MVIGEEYQRISEFGIITAKNHRRCFQKFSPFPGRVENKKCHESLRLLNILKNVLQIVIEVLKLYKKGRR